jgi:hypothetical protein
MRATSGLEPSDDTRMSLAGGELDGVRARARGCGLSDRDLLRGADEDDLPPAAWSMTKRSEEAGCTQKTLHAQIVDACYFSDDCQPRDARTLRFSATNNLLA